MAHPQSLIVYATEGERRVHVLLIVSHVYAFLFSVFGFSVIPTVYTKYVRMGQEWSLEDETWSK